MSRTLLFAFLLFVLAACKALPPHLPLARTPQFPLPTPTQAPLFALSSLQPIRPDNATQIASVMQLGKGAIRDYTWAADGNTIALATSLGVYLYDATTLEQKLFIATEVETLAITLNPQGTTLAASLWNNTIRIWNVHDQQLVHTFSKHTQLVFYLAFSPNGQILASLGRDGTLRAWNMNTGAERYSLSVAPDSRFIFSPDGRFIANGGGKMNLRVQIFDATEGKLVRQVDIVPDMGGMAFSPDSQWLAFSQAQNTAVLVSVSTGTITRLVHDSFVSDVAFSHDGLLLATTGGEQNVRFWDVRTGTSVREFKGYTNTTLAVAFSPNGESLAAMDYSGDFRIWNLQTGQPFNSQSVLPLHGKLTYRPHENRVALLQGESFITFEANESPRRLLGHAGQTFALAFSADAKLLASGDSSGLVHLWDLDTGNPIRVLAGHRGPISELSFRSDGTELASRSVNEDTSARFWDVVTGQILNAYPSDSNFHIGYIGFRPDNAVLVASGFRGLIVSDLSTGTGQILEDRPIPLFRFALNADGKHWAYSDFDGNVFVGESNSNKKLKLLAQFAQGAGTLMFNHDGKLLLTGDQVNTIGLWNTDTGQLLQTIQGRGIDAALNPDGTLITFKPSFIQNDAAFQQIVLWDVSGNQRAHLWNGGQRPLAFSPDGRLLASGSTQGIITLWGVQ